MGEGMKEEEDTDRAENERWGRQQRGDGGRRARKKMLAVVAGGAAPRRRRGLVLPLSTPRTSRFSQLAPSQQLTKKNTNTPNKEREAQL